MRVAFDVSPLVQPHPPGVVRATAGLVSALERRGVLEVVRVAPEPDEAPRPWRQKRVPQLLRALEAQGFHSAVSAIPLRAPCPVVQTVHELPWRHGVEENADLRHRLWAALGPLRAARVVCPSEHVAADLRARRLPGAERVRVIPWGREERFTPEPAPGEVDEVLLGRYSLGQDALLFCPGAVRAKKNLAALLHGLAALVARKGPRFQVVVSGEHGADLRRDLGLVSRLGLARYVSTPGTIEDAHLPGLYRLATAVPVLSRSEGFAFPVLEALACGTPVIVPRDSAQAELAGAAGFVVDPGDPESVADALLRAHTEREELRFVLPERAAGYTWDLAAERVEALWKELA